MVKPGYRTSEFWFTLVSFMFSGLYLLGLLDSNNQKEDLIHETTRGVEAIILIGGQLTVLYKYIKGRTEVKKTWWSTASPAERVIANKTNSKRGKKDETSRIVKTRARKSNKRK
jgi:hypothetical protein